MNDPGKADDFIHVGEGALARHEEAHAIGQTPFADILADAQPPKKLVLQVERPVVTGEGVADTGGGIPDRRLNQHALQAEAVQPQTGIQGGTNLTALADIADAGHARVDPEPPAASPSFRTMLMSNS